MADPPYVVINSIYNYCLQYNKKGHSNPLDLIVSLARIINQNIHWLSKKKFLLIKSTEGWNSEPTH